MTEFEGKTLFVISPAFPPDTSDEHSPWVPAQQLFIRALNRCFPSLEVIVFTMHYPDFAGVYDWHGNDVHSFAGNRYKKLKKLLLFGKMWWQMFRLKRARKNKIAGIISFWGNECSFVGTYFGRATGLQHLCWICGQDARATNFWVKWIRPKPGELVAMSDFLAVEFHKNHGIQPQYIFPDAIDPALFPVQNFERTWDILGVGSLIPLKRYELFIEIVEQLKKTFPHIKTAICGDGSERLALEGLIQSKNLEDNVVLLGWVPHKGVLELMKKSKMLLHTSGYEGFGNVCIEALYAGTQVLGFTRAMDVEIENWHIVASKEEMVEKAMDILKDGTFSHTPVLPFHIDDTVKAFMAVLKNA